MIFSQTLIAWYRIHKRDLPWRGTNDAYHIWLSEIIMQQTRVEQGTAYYLAFVKAFPKPADLAKAPIDQVLKLWQGLGYYSRARNLHEAAKTIVNEHKGKFPDDYESILSLKGVGEYTAAAIASFAFNKPHAVVDGNVYRLLSRVFGVETPIDSTAGKKEFRGLAASLIDDKDPGTYNQAIMEFGSRHCKPLNPDCNNCVFASICVAREKKTVALLPVKANKTKVRDRYFQYLVIHYKDKTWLRKRTEKDIWQGLYDFPLIETDKELDEKALRKSAGWKEMFGNNEPIVMEESHTYKHILSHQRIYARFWTVRVSKQMKQNDWTETNRSSLDLFAVPRLVDLFLNERS
ncbi:MAG TPA: A/G-specific adenine glycosylase [Bacteroidia bacterium]|jgi:A/G-specific adenine glycosylase|nr:A/G-specific adenine glycosylase [Bacteroidia bacterium]